MFSVPVLILCILYILNLVNIYSSYIWMYYRYSYIGLIFSSQDMWKKVCMNIDDVSFCYQKKGNSSKNTLSLITSLSTLLEIMRKSLCLFWFACLCLVVFHYFLVCLFLFFIRVDGDQRYRLR